MCPYFVGSRLNCKPFDKPGRLSPSPVFVKSSEGGYAVLFRYGVVVFLNTPQADETAFLENIKPQISQELEIYEEEFIEISANKQFKDGFKDEEIRIKSFDTARLETIAEILSRSVVLSYYEREMATTFDKIEPVTERLQKGHPSGRQVRTLLFQDAPRSSGNCPKSNRFTCIFWMNMKLSNATPPFAINSIYSTEHRRPCSG